MCKGEGVCVRGRSCVCACKGSLCVCNGKGACVWGGVYMCVCVCACVCDIHSLYDD